MSGAYFNYMEKEVNFAQNYKDIPIRQLPVCLEMSDWEYTKHNSGRKIVVIGEQWMAKNPFMITQMLAMLPSDYTVDILGKWNEGVWRWTEEQFWYEVRSYGLEGRVTNTKEVPWGSAKAVDEWLNDKDYLVTFSAKDAFSIVVAEAMAKGIKAFPHDFMGSKDIWGKYVWKTLPELVDRIQNESYNSEEYRQYIQDNYSADVVLTKLEEIFKNAVS
jgi:glycosyltransferase involved in cell wall biosynthesis